jgi:uncharacterized membrane protein
MIDVIFAVKFVHVLAAATMFGTWLTLAIFRQLAHDSRNTSVVALVARFAVIVEWTVMVAAVALQPITGFLLAFAIGVSPLDELWLVVSEILFVVIALAWIAAFLIQRRIRKLTHQAVLDSVRLPDAYYPLFRVYAVLTWPAIAATALIFLLMVWQPRPL